MHWRFVALALVVGVGACSNDGGDLAEPSTASPIETTSTSTSSSAATSTSTSTTFPLTERIACPRPAEPVAVADLDGDGTSEIISFEAAEGGELLVVCGPQGGRSVELDFAVWYVAVLDVESDGIDEVLVGPGVQSFGQIGPQVKLRWLDPTGTELRLHSEDHAGVWAAGARCVDHNGDGVRQLVHVVPDWEASTDDTIVWIRKASDARPVDDIGDSATGEFTVGRDDVEIALLSVFSCGDDLVELIRVPPPAAICDDTARKFRVDLDGDGIADVVAQHQSFTADRLDGNSWGSPAAVVCTSTGIVDEILVRGMGEAFTVSHGPGDGPIIWTGGTGISSVTLEPMVLVGDRLAAVEDNDGPITVWEGTNGPDEKAAFGCYDLDGDGLAELVQLSGKRDSEEMLWRRRSWTIQGAKATMISDTSGRLPWPTVPAGELPPDPDGYLDLLAAGSCDFIGGTWHG